MKVGQRVKLKNTDSWASPVVTGVITKIDHRLSCFNYKVYLSTPLDGTYHDWYSRHELISLESEEATCQRQSRIRTEIKEKLFEEFLIFFWGVIWGLSLTALLTC
jgi:hypothetical protein